MTLGTLLAATRATGRQLQEMRVAFLGGGSAGCGIAEQIIAQMCCEGLSEAQARERVYMVDRYGLLLSDMQGLTPAQQKLAQSPDLKSSWGLAQGEGISLKRVVEHGQPDILIGVSGQAGLFSEELIRSMHSYCQQPIIFPLSNPTSRIEATPQDILKWTSGQAIVATGSPFNPVELNGKRFEIAQCNNSYIFPGVGLGVLVSGANRVTHEMLMAASRALADASPLAQQTGQSLLPPLSQIQRVSKKIALEVAKMAQQQGLAYQRPDAIWEQLIEESFWTPHYRQYRRSYF